VKDIRSFLEHAGFYHRFIKNFSKIARLLTNLLAKDVSFILNDGCLTAWKKLKMELIFAPIISPSDWSKPFEIMCDPSDFAIGAVPCFKYQPSRPRYHPISPFLPTADSTWENRSPYRLQQKMAVKISADKSPDISSDME